MKESILFLEFMKKYWLFFLLPVILGLVLSLLFYSAQITRFKISQSFKLEYNLANTEVSFALTDQAVAELRQLNFAKDFPASKATIFKGAPLMVNIEVVSPDKDESFALLLKETEHLRNNFTVSTVAEPKIETLEPNIYKYLLTGVLLGFLVGLLLSLLREYFKKY